jgi:hypothetical protein
MIILASISDVSLEMEITFVAMTSDNFIFTS